MPPCQAAYRFQAGRHLERHTGLGALEVCLKTVANPPAFWPELAGHEARCATSQRFNSSKGIVGLGGHLLQRVPALL
jgi:hypothetical protein